MLKYITKTEYEQLLGTKSVPDNFDNLVIQASNYINCKTFNRIDEKNISEQVKYVTCLFVDLINEKETKINEIGVLKSQSIGKWSESYATPKEIEKECLDKMDILLKDYLCNEIGKDEMPLLYCGVI